jgi:hypothetical protein
MAIGAADLSVAVEPMLKSNVYVSASVGALSVSCSVNAAGDSGCRGGNSFGLSLASAKVGVYAQVRDVASPVRLNAQLDPAGGLTLGNDGAGAYLGASVGLRNAPNLRESVSIPDRAGAATGKSGKTGWDGCAHNSSSDIWMK